MSRPERRVFAGVVRWERNEPYPELEHDFSTPEEGYLGPAQFFEGMVGKRVRLTIEVLDDAEPKGGAT